MANCEIEKQVRAEIELLNWSQFVDLADDCGIKISLFDQKSSPAELRFEFLNQAKLMRLSLYDISGKLDKVLGRSQGTNNNALQITKETEIVEKLQEISEQIRNLDDFSRQTWWGKLRQRKIN